MEKLTAEELAEADAKADMLIGMVADHDPDLCEVLKVMKKAMHDAVVNGTEPPSIEEFRKMLNDKRKG